MSPLAVEMEGLRVAVEKIIAERDALKERVKELEEALNWLYTNANSKYPVRDLDESIEHARIILAKVHLTST